jgi:chemotaxis protein CheD
MENEYEETDMMEVGIGDFLISDRGILITYNLGSCVGLSLCSRTRRIGALLHIKLPEDQKYGGREVSWECQPLRREKLSAYADAALPIVLYEFERMGIPIPTLEAKMAGGARMFPVHDPGLDIGRGNIDVTKRILARYGIRLAAEDTGGTCGRTMLLNPVSGTVRIVPAGRADEPREL